MSVCRVTSAVRTSPLSLYQGNLGPLGRSVVLLARFLLHAQEFTRHRGTTTAAHFRPRPSQRAEKIRHRRIFAERQPECRQCIFMSTNHPERQQRKAGTHDRAEKHKSSTGPIRSANTIGRAHALILIFPDVRHGMCFRIVSYGITSHRPTCRCCSSWKCRVRVVRDTSGEACGYHAKVPGGIISRIYVSRPRYTPRSL